MKKNCTRSNSIKRIAVFLFLSFVYVCVGFAEIYDLGGKEKEAKAIFQEKSFVKLRFKENPEVVVPIFVYDIKKVSNPHVIPNSMLEKSQLLLEKGNMYFSRKEYNKAIDYYQKSLFVNPEFVVGYHNIGVSYLILKKYSKSIDYFKKTLEITPLRGTSYFYLGLIYKRLENFSLAKDYLETAKDVLRDEKNGRFFLETDKLLGQLPKNPAYYQK